MYSCTGYSLHRTQNRGQMGLKYSLNSTLQTVFRERTVLHHFQICKVEDYNPTVKVLEAHY